MSYYNDFAVEFPKDEYERLLAAAEAIEDAKLKKGIKYIIGRGIAGGTIVGDDYYILHCKDMQFNPGEWEWLHDWLNERLMDEANVAYIRLGELFDDWDENGEPKYLDLRREITWSISK